MAPNELINEMRALKEMVQTLTNFITFKVDNLTRDQVAKLLVTSTSNVDKMRTEGRISKSGENVKLKAQSNGRFKRKDVAEFYVKVHGIDLDS